MKTLESSIGKACFIFGVIVNTAGGIMSTIMKDCACTIPTFACLTFNVVAYLFLARKRKYSEYTGTVTFVTGCLLFPWIMWNSDFPEQAILYQFVIPVSFTLMKHEWPFWVCMFTNIFIDYIKFDAKYPGTGIVICIIFLVVCVYISRIVKYYKIFFDRDYKELQRVHDLYANLAKKDKLTGLKNRLAIAELVKENEKYCTAIVDIDLFKHFNDDYGHDVGDEVLCRVAKILERRDNENFMVSRWGGEEFILVSSYNQADTRQICEGIRAAVESGLSDIKLTVSIGISHYDLFGDDTFKEADIALYKAKDAGRNTVKCYTSSWKK